MPVSHLSTAKIARAVGCHPNTVRMYEAWGLIHPVPRSANGYRMYEISHLNQMQLARTALNSLWPGRTIRQSAYRVVHAAAAGDLGGALELAYQHLATIQAELAQSEAAVRLLERWSQGTPADSAREPMQIKKAARLLNLSADILRNWERNGLIEVPRKHENGYRVYTQTEISRLRVIRMLRSSGYGLMAILRMLNQLEEYPGQDPRSALDKTTDQEDILTAADRWLTTLTDQVERAGRMISILEERIQKENGQTPHL